MTIVGNLPVSASEAEREFPARISLRTIRDQLGVANDGSEQVIEIVRHAAGELTDRFHLLRVPQLFFLLP